MPTPANLTDDELLRMYGDVFDSDPATLELSRRFAATVDNPCEGCDSQEVELELGEMEEEYAAMRRHLVAILDDPADLEKQREARRFLGLPPRDDPH